MPVPYGFGVGDFIALGELAWKVYKACKAAPESFRKMAQEVASLHVVVKEAERILFSRPLTPERTESIKTVTDGCVAILNDLQSLVDKYESLGTEDKGKRDRLGFAQRDVAEYRARLTSNVTMINVLISTSEMKVEQNLNKLITDTDPNTREGSIMSTQTVDSLTPAERLAWREIRKDLEGAGISLAAFEANRDFIVNWIADAVETDDKAIGVNLQAESPSNEFLTSQTQISEAAKTEVTSIPKKHRKLPNGLLKLYQFLSLKNRRALVAASRGDYDQMFRIIEPVATSDQSLLNELLFSAVSREGQNKLSVVERLLEDGANVNAQKYMQIMGESTFATPLVYALEQGQEKLVKLLVSHGADPMYQPIVNPNITPYYLAINYATADTFAFLLHNGLNVDGNTGSYFTSPLHDLMYSETPDFPAIATLLVDVGTDIDISVFDGRTPLMEALSSNMIRVAQVLIDKGANLLIDLTGNGKAFLRNVIEAAVRAQAPECLSLLMTNGVRDGWLRALDERSEILGCVFLKDRTSLPRRHDNRGELRDGYNVLMKRCLEDRKTLSK